MKTVAIVALALGVAIATPVYAQDAGNTNMEILLQKVKADKKLLVASNMGLSDAEGQNFWPLYDAYQKELEEINQRLDRTINEYADRSEEHTSELQSRGHLVCRLLLEK